MYHVVAIFVAFVLLWYFVFFFRRTPPLTSYREPHDILRCSKCSLRERRRVLRDLSKPAIDRRNGGGDTMRERVDCSIEKRFCVTDADCTLLCKEYKRLLFRCDASTATCEPRKISNDDPVDDREKDENKRDQRCDAKNGEYAMLVGYTTLGTALWQCVQLYRHFRDRSKFCEGGEFDMRADLREPSYRDCTCPSGTIRAVYKHPTAYERIGSGSLPHCVSTRSWNLYRASMTDSPDDYVASSLRKKRELQREDEDDDGEPSTTTMERNDSTDLWRINE